MTTSASYDIDSCDAEEDVEALNAGVPAPAAKPKPPKIIDEQRVRQCERDDARRGA